jgi:hypothetical protein
MSGMRGQTIGHIAPDMKQPIAELERLSEFTPIDPAL